MALVEFGGVERARAECQRQRPGWWMGTVAQDVRYAVRGFRRSKAFAVSAVLTLALGIGATTAVFSVVDPILFSRAAVWGCGTAGFGGVHVASQPEEFMMGRFYLDWQANQKPFAAIASQGEGPHPCDLVENQPAELECVTFQAGMLPMLGISPVLGRDFLPRRSAAWAAGGDDYVRAVAGALRRRSANHWAGDQIDGNLARVVGVLPRNFQFPTLELADVVKPMALNAAVQNTVNGGFGDSMRTFARLKPGVSLAEARAEMQPVSDPEMAWLPERMRN